MIEALLIKIASSVFKNAVLGGAIAKAASAYEIYSIIDGLSDSKSCLETTNDCQDLGEYGVKVISDHLTESVAEKLIQINNYSFSVEKTKSGVYVASRIAPRFRANNLVFPSLGDYTIPDLSRKKPLKPNW